MNSIICLSGGADGADLQWGMTAGMAGHTVFHFNFAGHRSAAPAAEIVTLTDEQLDEANEPCKRASRGLKRWFPPKNPFVKNLLRRNWFQVRDAERVYAISTIVGGLVQGGTAWAVQMFIDRFDGAPCPVFVFDQDEEVWYTWDGEWTALGGDPPAPEGVYAGIGTRKLNAAGKAAVRRLNGYKTLP